MRIFNKDKTQEIFDYDENKGYLLNDTLEIGKTKEIPFIKEEGYYKVIKEYPNGGKDVKWITTVKGQEYKASELFYEDIKIFVPYTKDEILIHLRDKRAEECFPIVNRGEVWYNRLTQAQKIELDKWYQEWLDVTETQIIPIKPNWLK